MFTLDPQSKELLSLLWALDQYTWCSRRRGHVPFNYPKHHAEYPTVLSVQASTCAEVASRWFQNSTPVLTTISCSPWNWFRMALEYPLDKWNTLLFGRFCEYSKLPNSGTRKFIFNLIGSVVITKNNGDVDLLHPLFLAQIFPRN